MTTGRGSYSLLVCCTHGSSKDAHTRPAAPDNDDLLQGILHVNTPVFGYHVSSSVWHGVAPCGASTCLLAVFSFAAWLLPLSHHILVALWSFFFNTTGICPLVWFASLHTLVSQLVTGLWRFCRFAAGLLKIWRLEMLPRVAQQQLLCLNYNIAELCTDFNFCPLSNYLCF